MGTWLRNLSGYRRYLQQEITFAELKREHPELTATRSRSKIPDPWDDYVRKDLYDRSWKRFRETQYRVKGEPKQARSKVKVTYDTHWVEHCGRYAWIPYTRKWGDSHYTKLRRGHPFVRYRVRESYRRHRVDKGV